MFETGKSIMRRLHDSRFATKYFVGYGVDVGAGNDSLAVYAELFPLIKGVRSWDVKDGDAQYLQTIADDSQDFIHSSHCLEHMVDPFLALNNWIAKVKPGGYLIITVPDEDMYERFVWPSMSNPDHKWSFTVYKEESWNERSINVMSLLRHFTSTIAIEKIELLNGTYRNTLPKKIDQTMTPIGECAIEFILRKRG